jgi:hypothetical protein
MQKPSGYDEAQAGGEFTPVDLGGHYAIIKQVSERQSSTGKDMIVVLYDFTSPDKQEGFFSKQFNNDDRPEKKWPFAGTKYIMVNDYNDPTKTSRAFKTFCTCVEKSNNYQIAWGGNAWSQQFKNKFVGVVFGEEESEYDGKIRMRRVPKWFCTTDKVKDQSIPAPKYLNGVGPAQAQQNTSTESADPFLNIPEGIDEEIPF